MATVTAVKEIGRGRRQIYVDGSYIFTAAATVLAENGLHQGDEISPEELRTLVLNAACHRGLTVARRLLDYRPRSQAELRVRLAQRGFEAAVVTEVLAQLAAQGALDDDSFARFWQDNRNTFSPRSRALLRHELQCKGVPPELIETALAEVDDDDAAYRAARPRAARYAAADETEFRNRLGAYLKRRGFSYEVMEHTLERLWRERED